MSTDANPADDLQIRWQPTGHNGTANLSVFFGAIPIHADRVNLSLASGRDRFAGRLCGDNPGIDRADVDARLLAIHVEMAQGRREPMGHDRERVDRPPYEAKPDGLYLVAEGLRGPVEAKLCNFVAEIVEEVIRDDGDEQFRSFRVAGSRSDGHPLSADVPSSKFVEMAWVVEQFGAGAIIEAGPKYRDHVRAAIQHRSAGYTTRTTYAHTGWRMIDGEWLFLHSGGAIGRDGLDGSIAVDLGKALEGYRLPAPPEGAARIAAIRASLGLLRFGQSSRAGSRAVAAATMVYPYRAAIGMANHSAQYVGLTGSHKTCLAALALQHFGAGMDHRNMPANWDSTANHLEGLMHAAKDVLLVIDDFVPGGSTLDVARAHKDAERVFRSQGNGRGRERLGRDGRLKPSKTPRGSVISTGEDRVRRKSADARTLPIRFARRDPANGLPGTIDGDILTACQADAGAGLYSSSMAAFVRWLAPRYESIRDALPGRARELRPLATLPGCHARTPDIVADLAAAFDVFLEFAVEVGAIDEAEAVAHREAAWDGLMEAATPDGAEDGASAAEAYLRLLGAALASHQAHLVDSKVGGPPRLVESACGWRKDSGPDWHVPAGSLQIGWTDGPLVYLEPDAAYQVAQRMATAQGESFALSKATVHLQLDEARKLARKDSRNGTEGRNRLTSRESLERRRRDVLVLAVGQFWGESDEQDDAGRDGGPY